MSLSSRLDKLEKDVDLIKLREDKNALSAQQRPEETEAVTELDNVTLKILATPKDIPDKVHVAVGMVKSSIELAKRTGKPYYKLRSVLNALLDALDNLQGAQEEIDGLIGLE